MHRDGNLGNPAPGVGALGNGLIDQLADPRIHHGSVSISVEITSCPEQHGTHGFLE